MKTDIQIAQEAVMKPIKEVAASIGIQEDDLELYGKYKAKLSDELWEAVKDRPDGKLVLVTAINPTPAGEGKTTTSVGLGQAMAKLNKKALIALREPSLGPCFGIKGGAAGGGYAQVVPMEDLNLHFTGDFHAITSANNLLAALLDNHIQQGNVLQIDPRQVVWKRCLDMNDRALRNIVVGLGNKMDGMVREDHFVITVASEIMAILCLADDIKDLKRRLGKIVVAYNFAGEPVTADDLQATGAMTALLKDAVKPNLIQTLEHTPALVHGGPFANIAHGCNSIRATKMALKLSDIAITEAGFGADLGAEKFMDIKCRMGNLKPDAVVIVATVRALKYNGGVAKKDLNEENLEALKKGIVNLEKHIENIQKYDFMVAEVTQAYGEDGTVAFTGNNSFRHISCLVQFDIKAAGTLSDAVLTNLSLEGGNIISSATYSFETEKVTLTQEGDSDLLSVSLNNHSMADEKEGVSYYFILNQKTSDTPVSLTLEYSVAGKSYAASISTFAKDNAFKEGTHQKYNIAVNGKEIQITGGEIGSWNDGGEMGDINLDVKTGDEENK